MLPPPKPLVNHSNHLGETLVVGALATASLEDEVSRGPFRERAMAEEIQNVGPVGDRGLANIPLQPAADFLHGADPGGHIFLPESEFETPIARVLTKCWGCVDKPPVEQCNFHKPLTSNTQLKTTKRQSTRDVFSRLAVFL